MEISISPDKQSMAAAAAAAAADTINRALAAGGETSVILATGASQFEMLDHLVMAKIDWSRVSVFHLDEYIGLPSSHPASFRRYMKERVHDRLPALKCFNYVAGDAADPAAECRRLGALISKTAISCACIGIGENGHLAFNDPPADFDTDEPYLVVSLDEACRRQQLGEGWFPTLASVPARAITMSVQRIMLSKRIICTVPDARKAEAVRGAVEGAVTSAVPASILQRHPSCALFLDAPAASLLKGRK